MDEGVRARDAVLLGAALAIVTLAIHGNRISFTNDEGIILEAAQRMAAGKKLYVDFFGYMSPGSYWLQELAFRLFGVWMRVARLIVVLDFAVQAAVLFWLAGRLAGRSAATVATAMFMALQISFPALITAQHRWDSGALALLAIAFAAGGRPFWSGVFAAATAVCTPSLALVGVVTAVWTFSMRFLAGAAVVATIATGLMLATGIWSGFLAQMAWLKENYSAVNVMPYGAIIGGYGALFAGVSGAELVMRAGLVFCLALPAILPVFSAVTWLPVIVRRFDRTIAYLLAALAAFVISAYPRPDVMHLAFVAPLGYCLTAVYFVRYVYRRVAAGLLALPAVFAAIFLLHYGLSGAAQQRIESPVGTLRVDRADADSVKGLLATIRPGETTFVYPYMPLLYFLTQGRNPSSFSYLAPGMMTRREELRALEELKAEPPKWILYLPVSREDFLRVFPNATNLSNRFETLESWIEQNYAQAPEKVTVSGYRLLRVPSGVRK